MYRSNELGSAARSGRSPLRLLVGTQRFNSTRFLTTSTGSSLHLGGWLSLPSTKVLAELPRDLEALQQLSAHIHAEWQEQAETTSIDRHSEYAAAVAQALHGLLEMEIANRRNAQLGRRAANLDIACRTLDLLHAQHAVATVAEQQPLEDDSFYSFPSDEHAPLRESLGNYERLGLSWLRNDALGAIGVRWTHLPLAASASSVDDDLAPFEWLDGLQDHHWQSIVNGQAEVEIFLTAMKMEACYDGSLVGNNRLCKQVELDEVGTRESLAYRQALLRATPHLLKVVKESDPTLASCVLTASLLLSSAQRLMQAQAAIGRNVLRCGKDGVGRRLEVNQRFNIDEFPSFGLAVDIGPLVQAHNQHDDQLKQHFNQARKNFVHAVEQAINAAITEHQKNDLNCAVRALFAPLAQRTGSDLDMLGRFFRVVRSFGPVLPLKPASTDTWLSARVKAALSPASMEVPMLSWDMLKPTRAQTH